MFYVTTNHEIGEADAQADWAFNVEPGYPGSRIDPPESDEVTDLGLTALTVAGARVECPAWLEELLRPSDDALLEEARKQLETEHGEERE